VTVKVLPTAALGQTVNVVGLIVGALGAAAKVMAVDEAVLLPQAFELVTAIAVPADAAE
jgi:hypothetical protein